MGQDDQNRPGASARREAERRRALRERRTMRRRPRTGRAILALTSPPAHEWSWTTGAVGEEILGASLEKRCLGVRFLHDRQMPGSRTNIDHIAISPTGVWVIDTKRYTGKIEVIKPLFGKASLKISGNDRTKLIDGLDRQVEAVRSAMGQIRVEAPVHGCLCFVAPEGLLAHSGLPLVRTLSIRGYRLYYPRRLAKRLNTPGDLTTEQAEVIASALPHRFPPAV